MGSLSSRVWSGVPPLLRGASSDEYSPMPWSDRDARALERLVRDLPERARAVGTTADEYRFDRRGTATTLRAIDVEHGGGFFDVPEAAMFDAAAAEVVFGASFAVAIVIALTLVQRETDDEVRGRIMGGVQMLFRVGLGAGALGMGALAQSVHSLDLGLVRFDGNQVGLVAGGTLIVFGALAATGAVRASAWRSTQ